MVNLKPTGTPVTGNGAEVPTAGLRNSGASFSCRESLALLRKKLSGVCFLSTLSIRLE